MRRGFGLLLSTAITSVFAVPLVVALPVLSPPTPAPHPVEASIESVPLDGVDRSADPEEDGADEAQDEAQQAEAEAATGLAPPQPTGQDDTLDLQVLTARRDTADFSMVAVTWDMPQGELPVMTVLVRTRSGQEWSDWQALDPVAESDDPTATGRQRSGTDPLWAGDSDGVQARVDLLSGSAPTGLKLELIDPGESAADNAVGATPAGSAAAMVSQPPIYSRASWGADESKVRAAPVYMATIQAGVLHHTVDSNSYRSSDVPRMIRSIYAYHVDRLRWNDIGYNFLVDRYGRIWEGRRGGIGAPVMGAHAGGFNTNTFGVSALGNLESGRPTSAMISGITRIFAWKLDLHSLNPRGRTTMIAGSFSGSRYRAGTRVSLPVIMGHRDVGYTACPGRYLYPYLNQIRAAVPYAPASRQVISGDWEGDGIDDIGWFDSGVISLRLSNGQIQRFKFGFAGATAVTGDWDNNGTDTIGVFYRGRWYLRNSNSSGAVNVALIYGDPRDTPVTGKWAGGQQGIGVVRGNAWFLRTSVTTGLGTIAFRYGNSSDTPLSVDWNGDGVEVPAVWRSGTFFLGSGVQPQGQAVRAVRFGASTDRPLLGDWDAKGGGSPIVVRGTTFFWRNDLRNGIAEGSLIFSF